jgi:cytochrome oxidase Cu insertion factor (SCO1/SenC/PrrC family)
MSDSARLRRRFVGLLLALAALGGIGIGFVARAVAGPAGSAPDLPAMHGQASWAPGGRAAAPFRLRDHNGARVSLAALRGRPVLLTFLDSRCEEQCTTTGVDLGMMLRRMAPDDRPTLVVVSVDPPGDTRASIRRAMAEWRLAGPWRWHWLRGTRRELAPVWAAYGITVQPTTTDITHGLALYLVDRRGFQRTGYLFPFLPNFVALDLQRLAGEQA